MPDPDFGNKPAIDILSRAAWCTLFFLFGQYKGRNNGDFSIASKICEKYGMSRTTARKGLAELAYLGLVIETRRGGLNQTSLFGLTWLGLDDDVSYKFDDGIKPSKIPMRFWMLQYKNLRTLHWVNEHERNVATNASRRAASKNRKAEKDTIPMANIERCTDGGTRISSKTCLTCTDGGTRQDACLYRREDRDFF